MHMLRRYVDEPLTQAASLATTDHRPWPLPDRGWLMGQTWRDLVFAHWRVPTSQLRPHVPAMLEIEEHSGSAWVGITPFQLEALRWRYGLPVPLVSHFPEMNVRTYVTCEGRPGIWFFSLNTPNPLAVAAARSAFHLPYATAGMRHERRAGMVTSRVDGVGGVASGHLALVVEPAAQAPVHASPGSLEHFLAERYCLYSVDGRDLLRADIHHRPWPLQEAAGSVVAVDCAPTGVALEGEPLLHFSARQDVAIWSPQPVT